MSGRILLIFLITAIILCGLNIFLGIQAEGETEVAYASENLLRLHVIGNSNLYEDQINKLYVRDLVLEFIEKLFVGIDSKDAALEKLSKNKDEFDRLLNKRLENQGKKMQITSVIGKKYFPEVNYGEVTLPAGEYNALQVIVGKGEGKNWWCVLFPSLCFINSLNIAESTDKIEYRILTWDIINKNFKKKPEINNDEYDYRLVKRVK